VRTSPEPLLGKEGRARKFSLFTCHFENKIKSRPNKLSGKDDP